MRQERRIITTSGVRRLRAYGFSLIELMLSISIVATSLILFIGIFMTMFAASEKGVDLTAGTVVASSQLTKALYEYQETYGLENLPTDGSEIKNESVTLNKTTFFYRITSSGVGTPDLRKVDVEVWWWQNPDDKFATETRTGYGKLYVKLSRLVYTGAELDITD